MLAHFTRLENLDGILQHGILPQLILPEDAVVNDESRWDGHPDASCLSISFPNYRMFCRLRHESPNADWVVLGLWPTVLWQYDCAFCPQNAATASVAATDLHDLRGPAALERLFDEVPGKPTREAMRIPVNFPTDPQAEVLVFDTVAADMIVGIWVEDSDLQTSLAETYPDFDIRRNGKPFSYRGDWAHWK